MRLESWRSAQEQGTLAARNMLGAAEPVSAVPWFWSDQYDLTLQIAGLAEGATTDVRRELKDGAFVLFHLAPDGRLLAASGIGPGNAVAKDIRLAEMLIARRAASRSRRPRRPGDQPEEAAVSDPAARLHVPAIDLTDVDGSRAPGEDHEWQMNLARQAANRHLQRDEVRRDRPAEQFRTAHRCARDC